MALVIAYVALTLAVIAFLFTAYLAHKIRRDRKPRIKVTLSWHSMMPKISKKSVKDIVEWGLEKHDMPPWCNIYMEVRNRGYIPIVLDSLELCQPPITRTKQVQIHGWQQQIPEALLEDGIPRGSLPQKLNRGDWFRVRISIPWLVSALEAYSETVRLKAKAVDQHDRWYISRVLIFKPEGWRKIVEAAGVNYARSNRSLQRTALTGRR